MNIEIINKLDEITNLIDNDKDYKRMQELKSKIESNKELLSKIDKLKKIDEYNSEYVDLKKEIINDNDFKEYKKLEKDLYLFIIELNKKLNTLKEKGI